MNELITEKKFPIQNKLILKHSGSLIVLFITCLIYLLLANYGSSTNEDSVSHSYMTFYAMFYLFVALVFWIVYILNMMAFHFTVEDKFLSLNQGFISKQQRHLPYGTIQNLIVKQDLLDRVLGIASLIIENASQGAGNNEGPKFLGISIFSKPNKDAEIVGFMGNRVSVPGLTKLDAEKLKETILQKMKENPIEDSQSGL